MIKVKNLFVQYGKKIILVLILLMLPLFGCQKGQSSIEKKIERLNNEFDYELLIYGEKITALNDVEDMPSNAPHKYIDSLDFEYNDELLLLIINKDIDYEELKIIDERFNEGVAIAFYNCSQYASKIYNHDFTFYTKNSYSPNRGIEFFDMKRQFYLRFVGEANLYALIDLIEDWLI